MNNYITARIEFYFKGQKFTFSEEINLDTWLRNAQGDIEELYDLLAEKNGLDRYRHEYDVMILEPIHFSQATGLAADYLHDNIFDIDGFLAARKQHLTLSLLQDIAKQHLNIDKLEDHPNLQAALLAAYHANKA